MFYKAKNKKLTFDNKIIDYIEFGKGNKNLIIIPGVGDGFKTVKGLALPFAIMYRKFAKDYKVYVFSRAREIKKGYSINDMANDLAKSMKLLNIESADIVGVSQGGMIAMDLAINHSELINKLILVVTSSRPSEIMKSSLNKWINDAKNDNYEELMLDNAKRSYTGKYLEKSLKNYKLLIKFTKPKSYERFIIQSQSCLTFDVYDDLNKINNKTYIIGARKDEVLGVEPSIELHEKIKNSELYIYEDYSHGVYEQAKDFNDRILNYLLMD